MDPIRIVYRGVPSQSRDFRTLVTAEEGSEARIVEHYCGEDPEESETKAKTEISLAQGSVIDHFRLQEEGEGTSHDGLMEVEQARSSRFRSYVYNLGGKKTRSDVRTALKGEGASCELMGLFSASGEDQTDNQTTIDHVTPHGTSLELYKGILSGEAQGIFNGRIIVRAGAQKTEARQTNKNLLLSKTSQINSQPFLEILANDVKCSHGSTTGRLDEQSLFYLRSRGISEAQARDLLTYAFASELVNKVPFPELRSRIERALARRIVSDIVGVLS